MPYELSDKYTNADIGLIVTGESLEELFGDAVIGLMDIIVELSGLEEREEIAFELEDDDLESLFYRWLSEIIYYKDADDFLVKRCDLIIVRTDKIRLKARLFGDKIDRLRHVFKVDVKAVTYYEFKIRKTNDHWLGEVVFDL